MSESVAIQRFFDEVALSSNKGVSSPKDLFVFLEMSAVETLIVWEDLDMQRVELKNPYTGSVKVQCLTKTEADNVVDAVSKTSLKDWLVVHSKDYGINLVVVNNKSPEGSKFVNEFGGFGFILRRKIVIVTSTASWLHQKLQKTNDVNTLTRCGKIWYHVAGFRQVGCIFAVYKDAENTTYCVHSGDDWGIDEEPSLGYYDGTLEWDALVSQIADRYDDILYIKMKKMQQDALVSQIADRYDDIRLSVTAERKQE